MQLASLCARRSATSDPDGTIVIPIALRFSQGDVEQHVMVRSSAIHGRAWLLVFAEVCASSQLDSMTAVAHAATLGVGGLVMLDGTYFLQHAVPASATALDIDLAIDLIAHEAARLRVAAVAPIRAAEQLFSGFAD